LWYRGYGEPEPKTVLLVGFERGYADQFFSACTYAGTVTNQYGIRNEESSYHSSLYVCRGTRQPWSEMWPHMQWFQ
jgi:hypothetical protein